MPKSPEQTVVPPIRTVTGEEADRQRSLVIDAEDVHKHFGGPPVLAGFSLHVAAGEIFGLIGPSGSGKTTAVHLCCGHLQATHGSVRVFGEQPTAFKATTRRRIGYLPQNFILYPDLTVHQNVAFAAGLYGLSERRCRDQLQAVLELVELWPARHRTARTISGGMQRRLALASALVHDPDLLFADEPTANLDPILRAKLWAHFRHLSSSGRTLLITTQYIDEAEYCDRVGLMFDGVLIAEGQPEALRRRAFGGDMLDVVLTDAAAIYVDLIDALPFVHATEVADPQRLRVTVDDAEPAIPHLLHVLATANVTVRSIGQVLPTFDEVFIQLIEQHGEQRPRVGRLQMTSAT